MRDRFDVVEVGVVHVLLGVVAADGDVGFACCEDRGGVACWDVFDDRVVFLREKEEAFVCRYYRTGGC